MCFCFTYIFEQLILAQTSEVLCPICAHQGCCVCSRIKVYIELLLHHTFNILAFFKKLILSLPAVYNFMSWFVKSQQLMISCKK